MAKYKYGKHCHLCACLTKDPIVRSYFRFLKYLTSQLQSFSLLSFIAVNFLRSYVIVCSCSEQLQECEWEICRVWRGKKWFSINFLWSVIYGGLSWRGLWCSKTQSSAPSCHRLSPAAAASFHCCSPLLVNVAEAATFSFLWCRILQYN